MQLVMHLGFERATVGAQSPPLSLLDLGGITVIQRALRSARESGATHALLLSAHPEALGLALDEDDTRELPIVWHETRHGLDDDLRALAEVEELLDDTFMYTRGDRVLTPKALKQLQPDELRAEAFACVDPTGDPIAWLMTRDWLSRQHQGRATASLTGAPGVWTEVDDTPSLMRVRSAADAKEAADRLFATLRKPFGRQGDGLTAYYINRPISLSLSRHLIHTPLRPNHVTAFSLLLGLFGAACIGTGSWQGMALGGLLTQVVSVIDGIDGEISRMKLLSSLQGQWFDSVSDDIIKLATFIGFGMAAAKNYPGALYPTLTVMGALFVTITVGWMYSDLIKAGVGSLNNHKWGFESEETNVHPILRQIFTGASYFLKRDTYTLLLAISAMLGLARGSFWAIFTGITIIFCGLVIQKGTMLLHRYNPQAIAHMNPSTTHHAEK